MENIANASTRQVPCFGGHFCPIFGQEKHEFISKTVSNLFDEKSLNQFYIRISVVGMLYVYISNFIWSLINMYSIW